MLAVVVLKRITRTYRRIAERRTQHRYNAIYYCKPIYIYIFTV